MYPAYVSKHNSYHEKQAILLIIPNREKCKRSKTLAKQTKCKRCGAKYGIIFRKKVISIIKRNDIKKYWFLLSGLPLFL